MKSFSHKAMTSSHKIIIMLLMLCPLVAEAQVSVSLSPVPKLQFLSNSGQPLAGGCVFFYAGGTTTPQAAYTDSTGTVPLSNPLILDAGGFSSPGGIWLANQSYKIKVVSAGGVNCATGVTQYTIDGISSALGLLNLVNTWTASNTFQQPIIITPNANQLVLGAGGNQTTLNFPAPASNVVLSFPSIADTVVGRTTTDTLTNKTLFSPSLGATPLTIAYPNSPVSTTLNFLAMLDPANAGTVKTWCSAGCGNPVNAGAIGICTSNCTNSGSAQIAVLGEVSCAFDGSTTVADYVGISQSATGKCTDLGASYPSTGQVLGRAVSTNVGAGTYVVSLSAQPEVRAPSSTVAVSNLTAQAANISSTPIFTPATSGIYRITCYTVVTQAATVSSTLPVCNVLYTDADSSIAQTITVTQASSSNTLGQVGGAGAPGSDTFSFFAKGTVAISYQTATYASSGATPMQYAIHVRLEGPL